MLHVLLLGMQHLLILIHVVRELIHGKRIWLVKIHLLRHCILHIEYLFRLVVVIGVGHLPGLGVVELGFLLSLYLGIESTAFFVHIF